MPSEPYTPSTEEVRDGYVRQARTVEDKTTLAAGFDRFIASVRAEAEAKGRAEDGSKLAEQYNAELARRATAEADRDALAAELDAVKRGATAQVLNLAAVIEKVREEAGGAYQDIPADNIDAILSTAPADVLAERDACVRKQALLDAAGEIRAEMGRDEVEMHQLSHEHELPQLSRVMLNGATRFAERLTARATQEDINA